LHSIFDVRAVPLLKHILRFAAFYSYENYRHGCHQSCSVLFKYASSRLSARNSPRLGSIQHSSDSLVHGSRAGEQGKGREGDRKERREKKVGEPFHFSRLLHVRLCLWSTCTRPMPDRCS